MKHDVFYMTTKRFVPMQLAMQLQMLNVLSNSNCQNMKKLLSVLALMLCALCCMADNKIYYTSSDGRCVLASEYEPTACGANIVSNTYENGLGVITFDGEVTCIGDGVFHDIDNLTSIIIPNSVTTIGEGAFRYCDQLRSIIIPNSVTSIGEYAFDGCTSLKSVTFGSSITDLGLEIIKNCINLKEVICYAENPPIVNREEPENRNFGLQYNYMENVTLFVPAASYNSYAYDYTWKQFGIIKTINAEGENQLRDFLEMLLNGELFVSPNIQEVFYECMGIMSNCSTPEQKQQAFDNECKPKLIGVWAEEKKAQVTKAKKSANNAYVNEVYDECLAEIDAAASEGDIIAVRQTTVSGIAAVTSARILYKYLAQGIAPVTPAGAGMRMKVTTQSDKVYEFKTKDVKSVEYYNKN